MSANDCSFEELAASDNNTSVSFGKLSQLVVLPHSIFALPFALSSLILALREPDALSLGFDKAVAVVVALVSARTAAMAFNRLVDADIDAKNPRTQNRHLPSGSLSAGSVRMLVLLSCAVFIAAAAYLGMHCLLLSPVVLAVLLGYSLTKRFTSMSHAVLGLALALAPGGAWWVLVPRVDAVPLLLMSAVLLWVAGFDILYSCQDKDFDSAHGLHSVPARFGIAGALRISTFLHGAACVLFFAVGWAAELGAAYYIGQLCISSVILAQHRLVSKDDLSRVNRAFFTFNGVVSVAYFFLVLFVAL